MDYCFSNKKNKQYHKEMDELLKLGLKKTSIWGRMLLFMWITPRLYKKISTKTWKRGDIKNW